MTNRFWRKEFANNRHFSSLAEGVAFEDARISEGCKTRSEVKLIAGKRCSVIYWNKPNAS